MSRLSRSRRPCRAARSNKRDTAKVHGLNSVSCHVVTWRVKWNSGLFVRNCLWLCVSTWKNRLRSRLGDQKQARCDICLPVAGRQYSTAVCSVYCTGGLRQLCHAFRWTQVQRGIVVAMDRCLPLGLSALHRIRHDQGVRLFHGQKARIICMLFRAWNGWYCSFIITWKWYRNAKFWPSYIFISLVTKSRTEQNRSDIDVCIRTVSSSSSSSRSRSRSRTVALFLSYCQCRQLPKRIVAFVHYTLPVIRILRRYNTTDFGCVKASQSLVVC